MPRVLNQRRRKGNKTGARFMEATHNRNGEERMIHISMSEEDETEPASPQSAARHPYTRSNSEDSSGLPGLLKSSSGPHKNLRPRTQMQREDCADNAALRIRIRNLLKHRGHDVHRLGINININNTTSLQNRSSNKSL